MELSITLSVSELLKSEPNLYLALLHIFNMMVKIKSVPNLQDFQIWFIKKEQEITKVWCKEDSDTPPLWLKTFNFEIKEEEYKFYCCNNYETGYTLMIPDDY